MKVDRKKVMDVLRKLDRTTKKIAQERVKAIKKADLERDEELRTHMLTLQGYTEDLLNLTKQIEKYISEIRISGRRRRRTGTRGNVRKLPPVGSKIWKVYKGKKYEGVVTEEGIKLEGFDEIFPSMTAACYAVTGQKNLSGWNFWKVEPPEEK